MRRNGRVAIFAQSRKGRVVAYEVIVIRTRGVRRIRGATLLRREIYPSDSDFYLIEERIVPVLVESVVER